MKRRMLLAGCVLVATASFVTACDRLGSWLAPTRCVLSDRPIQPGMAVRIDVEDGGPSGDACCLACAITYGRQTGKAVRVRSVTDYISHERVRPDKAVYVVGSKVRHCAGPPIDVPAGRRQAHMQSWDRCLPTVTAFAHREDAERFQKEGGGTIQTFAEFVKGTNVTAKE